MGFTVAKFLTSLIPPLPFLAAGCLPLWVGALLAGVSGLPVRPGVLVAASLAAAQAWLPRGAVNPTSRWVPTSSQVRNGPMDDSDRARGEQPWWGVAPSAVPFSVGYPVPRALDADGIRSVVRSFRDAATIPRTHPPASARPGAPPTLDSVRSCSN